MIKMAAEEHVTQVITQAAKAAIMADKEVDITVNVITPVKVLPRTGSPALKQKTSDLKAIDKYQEL